MTATIETSETMTAREIAKAIRVGTRTRKFVLRDEYGLPIRTGARRYTDVLAALSNSDISPDLTFRMRTVAYALRKCMVSGRMDARSENRIADYSPYQLCALVARIARECPETTIGGICDVWLLDHHASL
ncbi:hypothetical protein [Nonomuraea sp. NPDC023979]|uniref:hypothetical protein n=1 Tax=Nonomuraea sp. NPDC023979 TaxID=3154796 RepID=UPI0033EC26F4